MLRILTVPNIDVSRICPLATEFPNASGLKIFQGMGCLRISMRVLFMMTTSVTRTMRLRMVLTFRVGARMRISTIKVRMR
jgi:hypothetical protein